jgi:hypothetical protein
MNEIKDYELPDVILVADEPEKEALSMNVLELFAAGELVFRSNDGKYYRVNMLSFWHEGNIMSVYSDHFGAQIFNEDGETVTSVPAQSMTDIRQRNDI